jgi:hypothetical protein
MLYFSFRGNHPNAKKRTGPPGADYKGATLRTLIGNNLANHCSLGLSSGVPLVDDYETSSNVLIGEYWKPEEAGSVCLSISLWFFVLSVYGLLC